MNTSNILQKVNHYYSHKIIEFGATPKGVDWNSAQSQILRFKVLAELFKESPDFSILDYGCGYGAFYDYLKSIDFVGTYFGFDISNAMLAAAKLNHPDELHAVWLNSLTHCQCVDFVVASGIFNVKLACSITDWSEYVLSTIEEMDSFSSRGFAFNMLSGYSDKECMRNDLYYADPLVFFDYCKRKFSPQVALLHDYNLYEFTIIVRK